jgi:tellurite resistance protein
VDLAIMVSTADGIIDEGEYDNIAHSIAAMAGTSLDKGMVRRIVGATLFDIKQEGLDARAAKVGRQLAEMAAVDDGLQFGVVIAILRQGLSHDEAKVLEDVAVAAGKDKESIHVIADSFATP